MKFLKALATPFVKLWNWIKQTAWVQPLLIVGCIFAVIFSIPYIASGIKNISKPEEDTMKFYNSHKIDLKEAYKNNSKADQFLTSYADASKQFQANYDLKKADANATVKTDKIDAFKKDYGSKFFFTFVSKECEACENFSKGFEYLNDHQGDFALKDGSFNLRTIVVDEDAPEGEDKEYKETSLYRTLFNNNVDAFTEIYRSGIRGEYYTSNLVNPNDYNKRLESMMTSDATVEVPLVCLIDLTEGNKSPYIASQIFYSIEGDHDLDKAQYLANAWNYEGDVFKKSVGA